MATAKSGRYWVGYYTSPKSSNAVKWVAKMDSLVDARRYACQSVIQSKYTRAYRVIDTTFTEISSPHYQNGYEGYDIYYHGRFGCMVAEYLDGDIEESHISLIVNGKLGKELRAYY